MQVFVRNFGCSANTSDGEVLAGCLAQAGFQLVSSESKANLLIYNTCAVKGPTEDRIINAMKRAPKNKKLIVAGCLPIISFERLLNEVRFDAAVGPAFGESIVDVVSRVLAGEKVIDLANLNSKPELSLPKLRHNSIISILPVNYGCLGSCAYCCVVLARGHLRSYSIAEIAERIQSDFAIGTKEFWITSQDTACYGKESGNDLANLLVALNNIPNDFRIRVGMMTPNTVTDIEDKLIRAFKSEKIFKFLHLPVQSGDNKTLKHMRRFYTTEQFKNTVSSFRAEFPQLTLATDIIVGFPGETIEAFKNTIKLLEEIKPDITNVSKFFARPKTAAAQITEGLVEHKEIKRRSKVVAELAKRFSFERNKLWLGWVGEVLVDEKGKVEGSWVGRNFAYKPIVLKSLNDLMGKTLKVKVVDISTTYLKGTLVES